MNEWMNDQRIKQLDPLKRQLIEKAFEQTNGKAGESLAPILMALITTANRRGIRFSSDEISLVLEVIKNGKSEKERQEIDQTVNLVNSMKPPNGSTDSFTQSRQKKTGKRTD
ncbi:MAG: hypothetical protein PHN80_01810 [Hespellia sp.]|nr:hypothetical protein [Hespellia sp.]